MRKTSQKNQKKAERPNNGVFILFHRRCGCLSVIENSGSDVDTLKMPVGKRKVRTLTPGRGGPTD